MMVYHWTLIRGRSREGCFQAFLPQQLGRRRGLRRHRLQSSAALAVRDERRRPAHHALRLRRAARCAARSSCLYPPASCTAATPTSRPCRSAAIAALRVAFERDTRQLGWGIALRRRRARHAARSPGRSAACADAAAAEMATAGGQGVARALLQLVPRRSRRSPACCRSLRSPARSAAARSACFGWHRQHHAHAQPRRRASASIRCAGATRCCSTSPRRLSERLMSLQGSAAVSYADLREFLAQLEARGRAEAHSRRGLAAARDDRDLRPRAARRRSGAAVRAARRATTSRCSPTSSAPSRRVAAAMGVERRVRRCARSASCSRYLKEPEPPKGLRDLWDKFPLFKQVLDMAPKERSGAPCQEIVWEGKDVDLARLPVQTCWPGDAGPLITWGLTVTRGPHKTRQNLGIYRQQVIGAQQASSCAGSRIAAARSISAITRSASRASRFRSPSRSAPIRRRCSAR